MNEEIKELLETSLQQNDENSKEENSILEGILIQEEKIYNLIDDIKTSIKGKDYYTLEDRKDIIDVLIEEVRKITPKKGKDYFTKEEIQNIINEVSKEIPDNSVDYDFVIKEILNKIPKPKEIKKESIDKLIEKIKGKLSYNDLKDLPTIFKGMAGTGYLREITDVKIENPKNNDALLFNSSTNLWENKSNTLTYEKVKYDASDPTSGYLSEKVVAGHGISLSEGTGSDENKVKISSIESDPLSLHLDQTTPQSIINGIPTFQDIKIAGTTLGTPTYSTINDWHNSFGTVGRKTGGVASDIGSSTIRVTAGTGFIKATDDDNAQLLSFDWAQKDFIIPADSTRYYGVTYNSGIPQIELHTSYDWDLDTSFPLGIVFNETINGVETLTITNVPWWSTDGITNVMEVIRSLGLVRKDRSIGGLIPSVTGTRNVKVTAGTIWSGLNEFNFSGIDTSSSGDFNYYWYSSTGGWQSTASTQYSVTQWNDVTKASLQTISNNKYCNIWIFGESNAGVIKVGLVYPQTQYNTAAEAMAKSYPESIPDHLRYSGILIGKYIIKQGIDTPVAIEYLDGDGSFTQVTVTNHNNLAGLQGGQLGEYYHLNSAQYSGLTGIFADIPKVLTSSLTAATGNEVAYTLNYTTNKLTSGNDTGLLIAMTDTASPGTSRPLDITVGGSTVFNIDQLGWVTSVKGFIGDDLRPSTDNKTLFVNNGRNYTVADNAVELMSGTFSNTSGTSAALVIKPTYNQATGTAANTDFLINRTHTAVGSGTQLLIDAQVSTASKFSVDNVGNILTVGSLGATGTRVVKGWFTDLESTNMPTVGGTAILTSLTAPQFTTIELGHASDTTISRSAAGVIAVEGVVIPSISSTNTLTNKRITQRVITTTDDATAVIDVDTTDVYELSAVANNTTFSTTGTPTDGQKLIIRFKDAGAAKALTWDAIFVAIGVTAPTTTVAGKWHYVGATYNSGAEKWHIIATGVQA